MKSNLRKIRRAKEITQKELATSCGISQGTLCGIEKGHQTPRLDTAYTIAKSLKFSVIEIWPEDISLEDVEEETNYCPDCIAAERTGYYVDIWIDDEPGHIEPPRKL